MPAFSIAGVRLAGTAAAVPGRSESVGGVTPTPDLEKLMAATGVRRRHLAGPGMCASDLCQAAASSLLKRLGWEVASIDLLILVTQTPDRLLPATACILHGKLGLPKSCGAFDVNLGCSGYIYGLSIAAAMMATGAANRALVLAGDTISKLINPRDRSVAYLFGDAGTATALETSKDSSAMHFFTGTDGSGAAHLQVAASRFRQPSSVATAEAREHGAGVFRSDEQLFMDGAEVFTFTLREVPPMIDAILARAGWSRAEAIFVPHQANRYMLDFLSKKMNIPKERFLVAMEEVGNTSSASIPLALSTKMAGIIPAGSRAVFAGFGVGLSWGAAAVVLDGAVVMPTLSFGGES